MDLNVLNGLRNGAILLAKLNKAREAFLNTRVVYKRDRPITDEVVLTVKTREEFPSRQTYRAYVRAWAKQRIRFAKAYDRGDLAPHLIPVVEQGL